MFIFWRPRRNIRNFVAVLLPVSALLFGAFLTHSRGALMALLVMAVILTRRRIGTLPALMVAVGLFTAAMAFQFTGGRAVSAEAGADRAALWSDSLQLLKSHPLFGVGWANLPDQLGHTAHNSILVCAAELGLFGMFFWAMFLLPTCRDILLVDSAPKASGPEPPIPEEQIPRELAGGLEVVGQKEINHLGRLMVLSLAGFLVAGLFLSRAFVMTFFLLGGIVEVMFEMALRQGMVAPRMRMTRVLPYAGGFAIVLVALMYVLVRILNLTK
jgi:hypothetical protein